MLPSSIFRSYDVRGEFGKNLTEEAAYKIAKAFVKYAKPKNIVLGMDNRLSSPAIKEQIVKGLLEMGVDVTDIGMVSTDVLYFATWFYKFDGGLIITASHMPKQYNGLKFLRLIDGMLAPIGKGLGMEELEEIAQKESWQEADKQGSLKEKDVWQDFVEFTRSFVDVKAIKPLKVIMDAGNGMAGVVAEKVFEGLGLEIIPMFFEPDGNFPNHPPNPFEEENRREIVAKVKAEKADLGIAWDADCDRVYFIDEKGDYISGDFITALLAINFLKKNPGSGIVYDLRASLAVSDWVEKKGGKVHMERVGHSYIKDRMRKTDSIFGGEVSGHYYFAQNAYMENGFAPALMVLEMMSKQDKKLSELIKDLGDYHISGEINFTVDDVEKVLKRIEDKYKEEGELLKLDGISFDFDDWRFNVRPSANDPVLRFSLEAKTKELVKEKVAEISKIIKE